MSEEKTYPVPANMQARTLMNDADYQRLYAESINDTDNFWAARGEEFIDWYSPWNKVHSEDMPNGNVSWYEGATLNLSYNCIDRHLATRGDQVAIIWEGDDPKDDAKLTYRELHAAVCRFANGLKSLGAKKGDRITIYMPMIPEAAIAILACARIGAVHSVVFGGFSPDSLANRILDCDSNIVITADEGLRGGRPIPLKANTDEALKSCPGATHCVVVKRTGGKIDMQDGRDIWYDDLVASQSTDCPAEEMSAEDPLFILYTSGSTGKPKGVLHTTGGYMVYTSYTHELVFDHREDDVYWCTADIGWITGHSYIVYGPLANGATTVMFEGVPTYPDAGRFWDVVDKHGVTIFYTAPTAIRALIKKLTAEEDPKKPLSDSKLAAILAEQNIKVARRTVAKYRESMNIPPSNERKRLV